MTQPNPTSSSGLNVDSATGTSESTEGIPKKKSLIKKWIWRSFQVALAIVVLIIGVCWLAYRSAQQIPEFYQAVLTAPPDVLEGEGQEFESRLFDLQTESHREGEWQAVFTEGQVNGWLASDLPEKFPEAIPQQVAHPRIRIGDEQLELAFRFQSRRFNGIVVAKGDAFCTESANEIAVRIKSAKAGIVPLPIGRWADMITFALSQSGTQVSWTEIEGDPTAIVSLPRSITEGDDRRWNLESVQLKGGQLVLSGKTVAKQKSSDLRVEGN